MPAIDQPFTSAAMRAVIQERDDLMRMQAGVTVVIPTHNDADTLHRALMSALEQTVKPVEILIIDDGSDREVVVPEWPDDHPEVDVWVYRVTNRGLPAARNTGLMNAQGFAFLPLDADDWIEPDYIEKTLPLLKDADIVLTGLQEYGPTRNGTYMPGFDMPFHEVSVDELWRTNKFFYCSLMRTQLLREVGGYNPLMSGAWGQNGGYEDWDLWIDLMNRGARFACVEEVLFNYTTKENSMLTRAELNRGNLVAEMRRHHRR